MGCSAKWIHDENEKYKNDPKREKLVRLSQLNSEIKSLKIDIKNNKLERDAICRKLYGCSWKEFTISGRKLEF